MATATDPRASEPVERPRTADDPGAAAGVHSPGETATAGQRPPTEAEIRERVAGALAAAVARGTIDIGAWVYALSDPLRVWGPDDTPGAEVRARGLWSDLRPSEEEELVVQAEAMYDLADVNQRDAVAGITNMIVATALAFAADHPDAPRAAREEVPA